MRIVCWLLDTFGVPEALIGDIVEAAPHRSATWLCQQVLVAIVRTAARDLRDHRPLALRGFLVGWTLQWIAMQVHRPAMVFLATWTWGLNIWVARYISSFAVPVEFIVVELIAALVTGYTIARLHRPYGAAAALGFVITLLLYYAAGFFNSFARGLQMGLPQLLAISMIPFVITPLTVLAGSALGTGRRRSAA